MRSGQTEEDKKVRISITSQIECGATYRRGAMDWVEASPGPKSRIGKNYPCLTYDKESVLARECKRTIQKLHERSGNVIENKAPHFLEGTGAIRIAVTPPTTCHSRESGEPATEAYSEVWPVGSRLRWNDYDLEFDERSGNVIENKAPHFLEGTGTIRIAITLPNTRHSRESGNPTDELRIFRSLGQWVPAFAGTTMI
jgi:hypothetical protein